MSSREYLAISKVTADLNTALSANNCVEWFADKLADASIISHSVRQGLDTLGFTKYQKASQISNALIANIRNRPDHLYTVVDIMDQERALWDVRQRLLQECGVQQSPVVPERLTQPNPSAMQRGGVRTTITSSLEDYLRGIPGEGLEEELAREVEEEKLAVIALHIDEWRQLCPFLGLKKVDECTILGNHPHSVKVQRKDMLLEWHSKNGRQRGTYRNLIACFIAAQRIDLADKVIETVGYDLPPRSGPQIVTTYSTPSSLEGADHSCLSTHRPAVLLSPPAPANASPSTNKPTLKELSNLLKGVDWYNLGVQLGLSASVLKDIEENYPKADRRRSEVLQYYLDNDLNATCEAIAVAMERIGNGNLARAVREMSTGRRQADVLNGHAHEAARTEGLRRRPIDEHPWPDAGHDSSPADEPSQTSEHMPKLSDPPSAPSMCSMAVLGLVMVIVLGMGMVLVWYYGAVGNHSGCTEILTVQLLYDELREAELDWKILGHELALGHAVLREIEKEPTEERRKRSVLEKWWDRRKEHCWQSIFEALYEVGKPVLADHLAKKYGAGSKKHEGTASPYVHER